MEESLIIEIWDTFKQYIPDKNKESAANQFVDFLVGHDTELETLEALKGFDVHIDDAVDLVIEEYKSLNADSDYEDYGYDDEE
jgi:hypothetical protein